MHKIFSLHLLYFVLAGKMMAQPFDTILTRFQYLSQIYPLEDSTFILIGQKDGVVIEQMNSKAETIWSMVLGNERDVIVNSVVHCEERDSSIQIYTARRDCDIFDGKDALIFTLTFNGLLLDSLKVPYEYNPRYIALLSGNPEFPRIAYPRQIDASDPDVILMFYNGDTMQIRPSIPGLDSSLQYLVGFSRQIALSPDSLILVCTNGWYTFSFTKTDGRYIITDRTTTFGFFSQDIFSLEPDYFIVQHKDYLTLYNEHLPVRNFSLSPEEFFGEVTWQNPYLMVTKYGIFGNDSIFVLDKHLNIIDKRSLEFFTNYPLHFYFRDLTYYWTSQPYHYLEGAAIHSMRSDGTDGPGIYDVGIKDVYVPAYDDYTTAYTCGKKAFYHFPYIILTLSNASDTPLSHVDVIQEYSCICPAWHWIRPIDHMDLQPGETDTFWLRDVTIANAYRTRYPLEFCLNIVHPDFHRDANTYPDNELCKSITLGESFPFLEEEIITYFPNPVDETLTLYTGDTIKYSLDIYDAGGRSVYGTREFSGGYTDVDVSDLPPGIYYLRFRFKDGTSTHGSFAKL